MANPTTNYGWVMPVAADLVTNLPAQFNTFGQAVDTSMAQLRGGSTSAILSKTSATDMAFTWSGLWTSFTLAGTGFTIGNGITHYCKYQKVGTTCNVMVDFQMQSTSSITGNIVLTLPLTSTSTQNQSNSGVCRYTLGATTYMGIVTLASTTTASLSAINASGTYATSTATSATIPATWANPDRFRVAFSYEVA